MKSTEFTHQVNFPGDIMSGKGTDTVRKNTSVHSNQSLNQNRFPHWFESILNNETIFDCVDQAFLSQSSFLLFSKDEREWIKDNFGLKNIKFLDENTGEVPNNPYVRGYRTTFATISIENSFQGLLKNLQNSNTEGSNYGCHIGIYPSRIETLADFIAVLNHEVNHWLLTFRIIFDFKNSGQRFYEYKNWLNETYADTIANERRLFITECLGYMEGGHSLFRYGNSGDDDLHRSAGKYHEGSEVYNQAAQFGALLIRIQINIYNHLARTYGLDSSKPQNFQLVDFADQQFQDYGKKVIRLLLECLYDKETYNLTIRLFQENKDNPKFLLDKIRSIIVL